jgi:outer membrane protein assembly factor BamB
MADDFDRFAFDREANDWEEFASLGALDDAPPPNPRFVRALRGELMNQAASMSSTTMIRGQLTSTAGSLSAPLPMPNLARPRFDRRLKFELAAVAILLLSLIGSISLYNNNGTGNTNNILNGLATQSSEPSDQPFALYQGDAARTGISPEEGPLAVPEVIWRVRMTNPDLAPALAVDGVIYLVDAEGGEVQAVSATTGMPFWGANVGRMSTPSIAVADGFVYVVTDGGPEWGTDPGFLIALKRSDGKEQWRYTFGGATRSAPAVSNGKVYVVSNTGVLHVVNSSTGAEEWQLDFSGKAATLGQASPEAGFSSGLMSAFSPVVSDGTIFVTAGAGALYAVDGETHQVKWTFQSDGNYLATAAVRNGQIFVPATLVPDPMSGSQESGAPKFDGWVYALNSETGEINWTWNSGSQVSIVAITADNLFTMSQDQGIWAINPSTGEPIVGMLRESVYPTVSSNSAIYVSSGGTIYAYVLQPSIKDELRGFSELWSSYMGVGYTTPVAVNDMLVTQGPDGTLVALGNQGEATTASPVAAEATPGFVDASGLPDCSAPAPIDWENVEGDPANTIPPFDPTNIYNPTIAFDSVPQGEPADSSVTGGILLTLHSLEQCARPGNSQDLSGFFSEDYFRRPQAKQAVDQQGLTPADIVYSSFSDTGSYHSLSDFTSLQLLPDGRVALFAEYSSDYGTLMIFVQNNTGYWVIDEVLAVSSTPGAKG